MNDALIFNDKYNDYVIEEWGQDGHYCLPKYPEEITSLATWPKNFNEYRDPEIGLYTAQDLIDFGNEAPIGAYGGINELYINNSLKLQSLSNGPKIVHRAHISNSGLRTLSGIGTEFLIECRELFLINNQWLINIPMLSILKIKNLSNFTFFCNGNDYQKTKKVDEIINRHLESKDIMKCQDDLLEAGLKEYARL